MKKVAITLFLLVSFSTFAQKYYTKTGNTQFKASVEAFEPVEATNKSTTAIININSGEIASLLFVKAFNFRVALMQEHFNENYMDSGTFPKAIFKGLISEEWQDKIVVVSGEVTNIDEKGIMLSSKIYCQLKQVTDLQKINPSNNISLKGRIIGYDDLLEELKLDQCIIQ